MAKPGSGHIEASPSLAVKAYDELRRRIVDGELGDRERLVIDRLSREFGISVVPIREALARLHAERLVELRPNYGYHVAAKPTSTDIRHWMEARLMIETTAAALAAERITDSSLAQLRVINRKIAEGRFGATARSFRPFIELNHAFHVTIVEAAGNPHIADLYRSLGYGPQISRTMVGRGVTDRDRIVAEHERIIAALARRDAAKATEAVRRHIVDGLKRVQAMVED
jgi:DNA-binding GntR family transcriptional regulator